MTVDGPPADYTPVRDGPPRCDGSAQGRAVVDTLGATGAAVGSGFAIAITNAEVTEDARELFTTVALVGALGVVMHVSSIRTTPRRTRSCREAERAWRAAGKPFNKEPVPEPPELTPEQLEFRCAMVRRQWRAAPATSPWKQRLLETMELYCGE